MKKIIIILLFIFSFFMQKSFSMAHYYVKNITVDSSDRMILINGEGNFKNQTPTIAPTPINSPTSTNITTKINSFTITSPTRYVIDIPNAILINGAKTYKIENSDTIKNVTLAQFNSNPNIVRAVFTLKEGLNTSKFKTYTNGKDIIVKYKDKIIDNSIQYKFYTEKGDMDKSNTLQNTYYSIPSATGDIEYIPRLQTKYYLSNINQNPSGIILKGIGSISLQKTIYNDDNTIATTTLDNTILSSKLDNKTYSIPDSNFNTTLTINRLNEKKVNLTLRGKNLKDYRFIISPDGQSLFICHRNFVLNTNFAMSGAKVTSYKAQKNAQDYYIIDFNFTNPVAYNVFELNDNFYLDIDNLSDYNIDLFNQMTKNLDIKITPIKISQDKTRFIIPMETLNFSYANVESNAKSIKLCFRQKQAPKVTLAHTQDENITIQNPKTPTGQKIEKKGHPEIIYVPKDDDKVSKIKRGKTNTSISSLSKVVIDPGHGGSDCGAIRAHINEKTLNLQVANLVKEKLMKKNIYVYMTRSKDMTLSLEDRVQFSNNLNPDIYVSIHTNSSVQDVSYGLETHYYKDDSLNLANTIHKNFASYSNLKKWETKDRGVIKSRFYVINHTEAPSVLIEMGFISNPNEREKLLTKKRQEEIAESIVKGILEYLKQNDK